MLNSHLSYSLYFIFAVSWKLICRLLQCWLTDVVSMETDSQRDMIVNLGPFALRFIVSKLMMDNGERPINHSGTAEI